MLNWTVAARSEAVLDQLGCSTHKLIVGNLEGQRLELLSFLLCCSEEDSHAAETLHKKHDSGDRKSVV